MTTRGCNRLLGLAMLAGLPTIHEARAQAPDSAQIPAFVDASRRADLRAAWVAANTDMPTTRERAEALSSRFAAEPSAQQAPVAAPAVVAPTETTSIDKAPAPPVSPPSVEKAQPPEASQIGVGTDDDGRNAVIKRRKQLKRYGKRRKPQPTFRVATSREELPRVPEESGALGPAGRLPTDYESWNLFPTKDPD